MRRRLPSLVLAVALAGASLDAAHRPLTADDTVQGSKPQVVVISLDGARADVVHGFLETGVLDAKVGLGRLARHGVVARQNITLTPSLTAVSHIGIATGSTSAHTDIPGNTFHQVATSIGTSVSGFAAPIGGYSLSPLGPTPLPTAEPLWVRLRQAEKTVVTATWPGSDGADVRVAGAIVQSAAPTRTVDYTVPFGAFGGLGARGFALDAAHFVLAQPTLVDQITAAGHVSYSPVRVTVSPVETVYCPATTGGCGLSAAPGRVRYDILIAALDTTNDGVVNYDTLVFFDGHAVRPIPAGPFSLPATGPAFARIGGASARFFFEGSGSKVGVAFFVTHLTPDLARVRFVRSRAHFLPRNAPALVAVDDINGHVGFWAPSPDFRILGRLPPEGGTFAAFADEELEAVYVDQVTTFTAYQTQVAL